MTLERKKVFGYRRVSTEEQVEGASLYNQERSIHAYAEANNLEVVRVYSDEGYSAKTAKRPQLQEMLEAIKAKDNEIQGVVVYNISRISRNIESYYREIGVFLSVKGVGLHSTQEMIDNTPQGKLMKTMFLAMHQLDNDMKSQVVQDNMKLIAQEGWWQGKIPYGYKAVRIPIGIKTRDGKIKSRLTLEPNNDSNLAEKIRLLLTRFSKGDITQTQLIDFSESIDLKSATGGRYTPQSINNMLRYAVYSGYIKNKLTNEELVKARHQGLISLETYQRNQDILRGVTPQSSAPRFTSEYPLKHSLLCSECHKPLTGSAPRSGSGKRSPRYHCTRCSGRSSISVGDMDDLFHDLLTDITPTEGTVRLFKTIVRRTAAKKLGDVNRDLAGLRKDLTKIDGDIIKSTQSYLDNSISKEEKDQYQQVQRERRLALERKMIELKGVQTMNEDTIDRVCSFIEKPVQMWLDSDMETKILFQKAVMPEGIEFNLNDRSFGTAKISPLYRLETNKKDPSESKESLMVTHVDITWNSFLPYLINLTDKLEGLGFRYVDNEVMAPKEVTDEK